MKSWGHLLFGLGILPLLFVCFLVWITLIFGGYENLSFVMALALIGLYVLSWVRLSIGKNRKLQYSLIANSLILLACIGYFGYIEYQRTIPTVSEFSHQDYRPFSYSSYNKVAKLSEKSHLQFAINDNLPKMDGSTALYPMYSAFANATYPVELKDDYEKASNLIQSSKTGEAYQRLLKGEVDVIFTPPPSKDHLAQAKEKGVEFQLTPIGKEAFVFFVNHKNPVENLQVEQIKQIYSGQIKNWREVGGKNQSIRAFQRPENSGSQTALQKVMGDTPIMTAPREDVPAGMGGIINQVANYRNFDNALGFSFLIYSTKLVQNQQIKLLKINGIEPNHQNIRAKTYPFSYDFYAVTLGNESPETKRLIEWIVSPQGQKLVAQSHYVPISENASPTNSK